MENIFYGLALIAAAEQNLSPVINNQEDDAIDDQNASVLLGNLEYFL